MISNLLLFLDVLMSNFSNCSHKVQLWMRNDFRFSCFLFWSSLNRCCWLRTRNSQVLQCSFHSILLLTSTTGYLHFLCFSSHEPSKPAIRKESGFHVAAAVNENGLKRSGGGTKSGKGMKKYNTKNVYETHNSNRFLPSIFLARRAVNTEHIKVNIQSIFYSIFFSSMCCCYGNGRRHIGWDRKWVSVSGD